MLVEPGFILRCARLVLIPAQIGLVGESLLGLDHGLVVAEDVPGEKAEDRNAGQSDEHGYCYSVAECYLFCQPALIVGDHGYNSAISFFPEDFHRLFGGRPVTKRALPGRKAPIVLDPIPNPLDDLLSVGPHKLSKTCVDRLLALG